MKLFLLSFLLLGCGDQLYVPDEHNDRTPPAGEPGMPGKDGTPGQSCSVSEIDEGALISCENGTSAIIRHGQDGNDGQDAPPVVTEPQPSEIILEGYFCSRYVIKVGNKHYLVHGGLILLSGDWFKVSATCQVRKQKGVVKEKRS